MAQPTTGGPLALPPRIVLYDGVCGLCHRLVAWSLRRDSARLLWFAPLQGETAARLRAIHPDLPSGVEGVAYVEEGQMWLRSEALLRVARHLPPPWRWLSAFRWLPAPLLDPAYRLVARVRYRIWGRLDACRAPEALNRERLLP